MGIEKSSENGAGDERYAEYWVSRKTEIAGELKNRLNNLANNEVIYRFLYRIICKKLIFEFTGSIA
jgi:hypothetical protein